MLETFLESLRRLQLRNSLVITLDDATEATHTPLTLAHTPQIIDYVNARNGDGERYAGVTLEYGMLDDYYSVSVCVSE